MSQASDPALICTVCLTGLTTEDEACCCPACSAAYHLDCWGENGGCGVYGCSLAPAVEPRGAMEIPVSHWGHEHKSCPSCGSRIAAAAVRCRQCGANFASANPQDSRAFQQRSAQSERLPGVRRMTIAVFIFCIVPCLAPVGVPVGGLWYLFRRKDIAALPALNGALVKIGLAIGVVEIVAIVLLSLLRGAMER